MTDINPGQLGEALNWKADRDLKNLDNTGTGFIIQTGTVIIWPGTTVPDGYLLCDGSAISRTTYAALFAVIGTTYGPGDSSGTFNLPNKNRYNGLNAITTKSLNDLTPQYVAEYDGFVYSSAIATNNNRSLIMLINETKGSILDTDHAYTEGTLLTAMVPCKAGDIIKINRENSSFHSAKIIYGESNLFIIKY